MIKVKIILKINWPCNIGHLVSDIEGWGALEFYRWAKLPALLPVGSDIYLEQAYELDSQIEKYIWAEKDDFIEVHLKPCTMEDPKNNPNEVIMDIQWVLDQGWKIDDTSAGSFKKMKAFVAKNKP